MWSYGNVGFDCPRGAGPTATTSAAATQAARTALCMNPPSVRFYSRLPDGNPLKPRGDVDECIDDGRIEVRASLADDHGHCRIVRQGLPVHSTARQRVVDVDHRHDAARNRNVLASQPARVAMSIPSLVVRVHNLLGHLQDVI